GEAVYLEVLAPEPVGVPRRHDAAVARVDARLEVEHVLHRDLLAEEGRGGGGLGADEEVRGVGGNVGTRGAAGVPRRSRALRPAHDGDDDGVRRNLAAVEAERRLADVGGAGAEWAVLPLQGELLAHDAAARRDVPVLDGVRLDGGEAARLGRDDLSDVAEVA